jgi:hypothetical protein
LRDACTTPPQPGLACSLIGYRCRRGNPVLTAASRAEQQSAEATPLSHCVAWTKALLIVGIDYPKHGSKIKMKIGNEWNYILNWLNQLHDRFDYLN